MGIRRKLATGVLGGVVAVGGLGLIGQSAWACTADGTNRVNDPSVATETGGGKFGQQNGGALKGMRNSNSVPGGNKFNAQSEEAMGPTVALNDEQRRTLSLMAEEEKVAHDLYVAFAEKYGVRTFSNIAGAEQRHWDAISALLNIYGIENPNDGLEPGKFKTPEMQDSYDSLLERGSIDLRSAFEVGKVVEVQDIADLEAAIASVPDSNVKSIYEKLRAGSEKHLAAFERQLS